MLPLSSSRQSWIQGGCADEYLSSFLPPSRNPGCLIKPARNISPRLN